MVLPDCPWASPLYRLNKQSLSYSMATEVQFTIDPKVKEAPYYERLRYSLRRWRAWLTRYINTDDPQEMALSRTKLARDLRIMFHRYQLVTAVNFREKRVALMYVGTLVANGYTTLPIPARPAAVARR